MTETTLTTWWESRLARRFNYVAVFVAIVIVCRAALDESISWVVLVLVGIAVVFLTLIRWPYGALSVLIGMSAMPRFFVVVFGWKARPEHFAALIVSVAACSMFLRHKRLMRLETLDYWVLAYVAINYISSAFGSSEPSATLRWAMQNNLAVLPYFLVRLLVRDLDMLRKAFRILLVVGIAECIFGTLCFISNRAFGTTTGMESAAYLVDVAAPYGSLFEPNLFGAYAGCCAVLFLALYVGGQRRFRNLAAFLLASLAAALSFSRAALLALIVAVCCVFWKTARTKSADYSKPVTFVLPATLLLVVAASALSGALLERFSNLYNQGLTEGTTITRLIEIQEALQDISNHPLLGSGTASFQLSFDWGKYIPDWAGNSTWVGNATIRVLHDTGLLGLAVLLGFVTSVWWKIRRGLCIENSQVSTLLGLSTGALLYGISFQATDGTLLAFTWVHLGFLASAAILINGSVQSANGMSSAAQRSI